MEKTVSPFVAVKSLGKAAAYSALATACFWASQANAQLLNNLTIGNPKALALGNAVTADPPAIDSIHFNPAGLTQVKGRQREIKLLIAKIDLESQFGYPTQPTEADKQTLYNLDNYCQANYPNNSTGYTQCWGEDSTVAGKSSKSGDPVLMLPFSGLTKIPVLAVPTGGIAFEDSTNGWVFGTAVYTPEGVGYTRDQNDPGAYQGIKVGVTRLTYFSPTVAIQVNDRWSIGAGVNFSYQGFGVETLFRAPLKTTQFLATAEPYLQQAGLSLSVIGPYQPIGLLKMEMNDYLSVGFNFGMLYKFNDWATFGFAYRSESTSHLTGDYSMTNSSYFLNTTTTLKKTGLDAILPLFDGAPFNAQKVEKGTVKLDYITPQNLAFGTSLQVLPSLKFNIDLKWVEYSRWDKLDFKYSHKVDFLTLASVVNRLAGPEVGDGANPNELMLPRGYKDVWSWAFGAEYTVNDNLVLRAGYEPRTSVIPKNRTDLLLPIGDAQLFSCGFGMQWNSTTKIQGAIGYLTSSTDVAAGQSRNANSSIEGDVVYNPYYSTPFSNKTRAYLVALSLDQKF